MVYRRYKVRNRYRNRKSTYRRKSRYGGRKWFKRKLKASRTRQSQFGSDRYFTKLRYSHYLNRVDASRGEGYYDFLDMRGNSLYDPDQALGGRQPLGFDQLAAMYKRYRVYASKIIVKLHNIGASTNNPYYLCIFPSNSTSSGNPPAWIENCTEQPYNRLLTRNSYDSSPIVKSVMSSAKIFGLPKVQVKSNPNLSAFTSENPVDQWYWRVCYGQVDSNASSANTYAMQIRMTYYVEFFERRNLSPS